MAKKSRRGKADDFTEERSACDPGLRCFMLWAFLLANSLLVLLLIAQYNANLSAEKRRVSLGVSRQPNGQVAVIDMARGQSQAQFSTAPPVQSLRASLPPALASEPVVAPPQTIAPIVAQVPSVAPRRGTSEWPLPPVKQQAVKSPDVQWVHWVFTTDCSAYMFNQGNLLLTSAYNVGLPGEFTWIAYGCKTKIQQESMLRLGHPRAKVWHAPEVELHDSNGKPYKAFQASNRPVSITAWYKATQPKEEAIAVLDPDMMFMRSVQLSKKTPPGKAEAAPGDWITKATRPKMGTGAFYGIGCVPSRWNDAKLKEVCGKYFAQCLEAKRSRSCSQAYSSGPPWIIDGSDAADVYPAWMDLAISVHNAWPDMLAEQSSYGITQMAFGVSNELDKFWFVSDTGSPTQPWNQISSSKWDPCKSRSFPPDDVGLPPLFHACSTFDIKGTKGFRIHKDHIHKDLLDCTAPLIHYPPRDSLQGRSGRDWREVWAVCTYTNLINHHATMYKRRYCDNPNLEPTFKYPPSAQSFLNKSSWLEKVFRRGGWADIDYKVQGK